MYCRRCGRPVKDNELFCKNCGTKLRDETELHMMPERTKKKRKGGYIVVSALLGLLLGVVAAIGVKWKDLKPSHEASTQFVTSEKSINSIQNSQMESSIETETTETIETTETTLEDLNTENSEMPAISMENIQRVSASSYLKEKSIQHIPERLIDQDTTTAWVEGVSGTGEGEFVCFEFDGSYTINGIKIWNGYQKSEDLYYKNARPQKLEVEFSDGTSERLKLQDNVDGSQTFYFDGRITSYVKISILSTYKGSKYEDTVMSEIELF